MDSLLLAPPRAVPPPCATGGAPARVDVPSDHPEADWLAAVPRAPGSPSASTTAGAAPSSLAADKAGYLRRLLREAAQDEVLSAITEVNSVLEGRTSRSRGLLGRMTSRTAPRRGRHDAQEHPQSPEPPSPLRRRGCPWATADPAAGPPWSPPSLEVSFWPSARDRSRTLKVSFSTAPLGVELDFSQVPVLVTAVVGRDASSMGIQKGMVVAKVGSVDATRTTGEQVFRLIKEGCMRLARRDNSPPRE